MSIGAASLAPSALSEESEGDGEKKTRQATFNSLCGCSILPDINKRKRVVASYVMDGATGGTQDGTAVYF